MSLPVYFPQPSYVPRLKLRHPLTLEQLCARAGVACRASGPWTQRQVEIREGDELRIEAEPGYRGSVRIDVAEHEPLKRYRLALGALAYSLLDGVARESIRGQAWAKPGPTAGRPRSGAALSNAERQRRFRRNREGGGG